MIPGCALDLSTTGENGVPWDFSGAGLRRKAEKLVDEQELAPSIGSPMCTRSCSRQNFNGGKRVLKLSEGEQTRADVHMILLQVCT